MSRRRTACLDGSHDICVSSDSGLPECRCWCAECREINAARAAAAEAHNAAQIARLLAALGDRAQVIRIAD